VLILALLSPFLDNSGSFGYWKGLQLGQRLNHLRS